MLTKLRPTAIVILCIILIMMCLWAYFAALTKVIWNPSKSQGVSIEEQGKVCRLVFAKRHWLDFKPKRFIDETETGVFTSAHWSSDESVTIYGNRLEGNLLLRDFKKAYPDYRGIDLRFVDEDKK